MLTPNLAENRTVPNSDDVPTVNYLAEEELKMKEPLPSKSDLDIYSNVQNLTVLSPLYMP